MEEFNSATYHPTHRRLEHDHHRRARKALFWGSVASAIGGVLAYWSTRSFWGGTQQTFGQVLGFFLLGLGALLLVLGGVLWFTLDDDPVDVPEDDSDDGPEDN